MPRSMYSQFKTNKTVEQEGIWLEFETFRLLMARAGGSNKKFNRSMTVATKPYRRAIESETMGDERSIEIMRGVYAKSVILAWEVKDEDGEWVTGMEDENGEAVPFTRDNVEKVFSDLPELFEYVIEQSRKVGLFLDDVREVEAGN